MSASDTTPNIIDLYSGVGGMSLGAARAGFNLSAAVELDPIAIATHAANFPNSAHLQEDVSKVSAELLLAAANIPAGRLDGLVGGPPCQGFSEIGKKASDDPRNQLFSHFFRLVAELRPKFFVAENVPGILAERNADVVSRALSQIPSDYVVMEAHEVAANEFGAPTTRIRAFFIGFNPNEMETIDKEELFATPGWKPTTVGLALEGLPQVRCDWATEAQGWRIAKKTNRKHEFNERLSGHVPKGVGVPTALAHLKEQNLISGNLGTRHTEEVIKRFKSVAPGATDSISRAPRLSETGFCPTLRAGTGSDRGSFQAVRPIHFSSPRVITPREGARLQGFPDWFQFHGTKWHAFRQIGNSVSPIVAEVLLSRLKGKLPGGAIDI